MKTQIAAFAAAATVIGFALPAAAQNIDTRAAATSGISPFGYGGATSSYGQTFTVPAGQGSVTSFSVRTAIPATTTFRGVLMRWDTATNRATGPVLFQSADVNTTGPAVQDMTFTIPGGASVIPGQTYVIFGSTVNSAGSDSGSWSFTPGDVYPGGGFVYQNQPAQSDWTGTVWDGNGITSDAGVTVNFAPLATVPTLSEWAMIGLTLTLAGAGAVFVTRRRRFAPA